MESAQARSILPLDHSTPHFESLKPDVDAGFICLQASQLDGCPSLSPRPLSSSPRPSSTTTRRPLPDQS